MISSHRPTTKARLHGRRTRLTIPQIPVLHGGKRPLPSRRSILKPAPAYEERVMIFLYILGGIAMAILLFANFAEALAEGRGKDEPPRSERRTNTWAKRLIILIVGTA